MYKECVQHAIIHFMMKPFKDPRTGVYYFRKIVPKNLREVINKTEIKVSLQTKSLDESLVRFHEEALYCSKLFTNAKLSNNYSLTVKSVKELVRIWLSSKLINDDNSRSEVNPEDGLSKDKSGHYGAYLTTLYGCLDGHDFSLIYQDIDHVIHVNGLSILKDSKSYNILAIEVLKANIRFYEVINRRSSGDYSDQLEDVLSSYPVVKRIVTIQDLYAAFIKKSDKPKGTLGSYGNAVRLLMDLYPTTNASDLNRPMIREYRDLLLEVPRLKSKLGRLNLIEIVKHTKLNNINDLISPSTVNKNIKSISAILSWGESNGYFDNIPNWSNPANGIRADESNKNPRLPFDDKDLELLFDDDYNLLSDSKFWIPLISLYSGARLEEIGQLLVTDIKQDKEFKFWYMDINDIEDGKRLKNRSAIRLIPIHNKLIELGFLEYVGSSGRVFKDLTRKSNKDKLTTSTSKWFGRYRRAKGVTSKLKPFHSFRHLFKDAVRREIENEELSDSITGHSNPSVGRKYGLGYGLNNLNKGIQLLSFDIIEIKRYNSR